jgi:hypothetical protein
MGLAFPTGGMKRGSTVKSLYTKSKVTKAKRYKKRRWRISKGNWYE